MSEKTATELNDDASAELARATAEFRKAETALAIARGNLMRAERKSSIAYRRLAHSLREPT